MRIQGAKRVQYGGGDMLTPKVSSLRLSVIFALVALALAGCGGDSDSPSATNTPPTGPSDASAFVGTTIEINPTIAFFAGGTITYYNVVASTILPGASIPVGGTYTYTPSADLLSGTLTLTMPTIDRSITFTLTGFKHQNGRITSFTATASGQNYTSQITSGTLAAGTVATTGGSTSGGSTSGGSTSGGSSSGGSSSGGSSSGGNTQAQSGEYIYATSVAGGPYTNGQRVSFTLNRDASDATKNTLQFSGKTLTNPTLATLAAPYTMNTFVDTAASVTYEVVLKDGTIHEINVLTGGAFKGQFTLASAGSSSGGSSSGGGTLPAGALAAGTTFTRTVGTKIVAPTSTVPADVPNYNSGQQVTFTVNSAGAMTFSGLTVPYSADGGTALTYNQVLSPGNSNTVIVYKNLTTGAPTGVALQFIRTTGTLPPVVTMVDYTLN